MEDTVKNLIMILVAAVIISIILLIAMTVLQYVRGRALFKPIQDKMSVGGHWVQERTYGHTGPTMPAFDLSGYYQSVPTPSYA